MQRGGVIFVLGLFGTFLWLYVVDWLVLLENLDLVFKCLDSIGKSWLFVAVFRKLLCFLLRTTQERVAED